MAINPRDPTQTMPVTSSETVLTEGQMIPANVDPAIAAQAASVLEAHAAPVLPTTPDPIVAVPGTGVSIPSQVTPTDAQMTPTPAAPDILTPGPMTPQTPAPVAVVVNTPGVAPTPDPAPFVPQPMTDESEAQRQANAAVVEQDLATVAEDMRLLAEIQTKLEADRRTLAAHQLVFAANSHTIDAEAPIIEHALQEDRPFTQATEEMSKEDHLVSIRDKLVNTVDISVGTLARAFIEFLNGDIGARNDAPIPAPNPVHEPMPVVNDPVHDPIVEG